jgi:phosphoglycerol transferase MdoB-like AlkP superfamily enzyme
VILTESVEFFGIDSYFTPNLHKLYYSDSLLFENYYTENKTNMSEGMALMGTYSFTQPLITSSGQSMTSVLKNLSLANSFKNNNIKTTYIHGYNKTFYNRDITFNKLGFDNLIFAADQESELKQFEQENNNVYNWSTSNFYEFVKDSSFVKYNIESFVPSTGKFFTTFASFTTHGNYVARGSNLSYYNELTSTENQENLNNLISQLETSGYNVRQNLNQFLYYKAAMMDLDKTIKILFDRLEETNNLDNTTIVLYSDHNAYYDDFGLKLKNLESFSIEGYHLPSAIYSTKLCNAYKQNNATTTVSKFVGVNDLYPTICDLFGFTYNKNLCYGKNIFLNENGLFISLKDRIIFDNNFYYFNSPVAITPNVSSDYFKAEVDKILYKVNVFENLFNNLDFFESLFENKQI